MLFNIQFLRFIAAMMVVLYHSAAHVAATGASPTMLYTAAEAVGFAGVDVFFVISGFIMFYTTRDTSGRVAAGQFLGRRFARIYSGYWPFFLLAWGLFAWVDPGRLPTIDMLESATLWPGRNLLIAVSWTLTFEMIFYLLFGVLVWLSPQRRILGVKLLFVMVVAWTFYAEGVRHAYDPGRLEFISLGAYYALSPYLLEFLGGALTAWWLVSRPNGPGLPWLIAGIVSFSLGGVVNNLGFSGTIEQGYWMVPRVLLFGPASIMILIGLVRMENSGWRTWAGFSLAAGAASYAIYLSHTLILTVTQRLGLNSSLAGQPSWFVVLVFLLLAAIILGYSILHYRIIERPLHRLLKTWAGVGSKKGPSAKRT